MTGHSEYEGKWFTMERNSQFPDIDALMDLNVVGTH